MVKPLIISLVLIIPNFVNAHKISEFYAGFHNTEMIVYKKDHLSFDENKTRVIRWDKMNKIW